MQNVLLFQEYLRDNRIFGAVPKVPDTFCTETPTERPSNERLTSDTPLSSMSSAITGYHSMANSSSSINVFILRWSDMVPLTE